jgi:hypothetical protein
MAYTILNTDGTTLLFLSDNSIDQTATSLTLVGKNYNNYGQYLNNNFVSLLENFASTNGEEPRSPRRGQLWYDTTSRRLNVYDEGFLPVGGAIVAGSQPTQLASGDLWWDSANDQLKIFSNNSLTTIGPPFPRSVGENGWVLPATTLVDTYTSNAQQVTLLKSYGETIGAISNSAFTLTPTDSQSLFNATTATLVNGLTISGDLQVTGQQLDKYLTAVIDIDRLYGVTGANVSNYTHYQSQNVGIIDFLNAMFPVVASTSTNEVGVPIGTDAKVVCQFTSSGPAGVSGQGQQVRRFRVLNQPGVGVSWQPYEIYTVDAQVSNVVTASKVNVLYTRP